MKNKSLISYYGGKQYMVEWIQNNLPSNASKLHLVDVFGGSGTVAINLSNHFKLATYNDIDLDIVNFFRVCRDYPDELINALELTPYSRVEHCLAQDNNEAKLAKLNNVTNEHIFNIPLPESEPKRSIEKARRYFVNTQMAINSKKNGSWGYTINTENSIKRSSFDSKLSKIKEVTSILNKMHLECRSFEDMIKFYDSETTFFYLDPPYYQSTRVSKNDYENEMKHEQHVLLLDLITNCKSLVMLSGYNNELYSSKLSNFAKIELNIAKHSGLKKGENSRLVATECLWMNYTKTDLFNS